MADLAAFLAARLDEDEAAARAAASIAGPGWKAETYWPGDESRTRTCVRSKDGAFLGEFGDTPDYPDMAAHVARHDPARVLREVAAGRAILADYEEAAQHPYDLPEGVREGRDDDERERDQYLIDVLEHVLRCLAAVYRDHPDYDPAWAV